jgi:hypothetical protein
MARCRRNPSLVQRRGLRPLMRRDLERKLAKCCDQVCPKPDCLSHRAHRYFPRVPLASPGGSCCREALQKPAAIDSDVMGSTG